MGLLLPRFLPHGTNNRLLLKALELLFLSAGFIYSFVMLKGYSCEIIFSSLISFWNSIKCFLSSPLYICIVINFMILLIAATSSTFQHRDNHSLDDADSDDQIEIVNVEEDGSEMQVNHVSSLLPSLHSEDVFEIPSEDIYIEHDDARKADEIKNAVHFYSENEERTVSEEDTIEATWYAITGVEKENPVRKELKKCETWNTARETNSTSSSSSSSTQCIDSEEILLPNQSSPAGKELRKSETFNDSVSLKRGGRFIRRDPSTSLEEFNKQVEAFIKKFNDDMRLQRQESDQRFLDMIGRAI